MYIDARAFGVKYKTVIRVEGKLSYFLIIAKKTPEKYFHCFFLI
jgi:hypothetical protein